MRGPELAGHALLLSYCTRGALLCLLTALSLTLQRAGKATFLRVTLLPSLHLSLLPVAGTVGFSVMGLMS